MRQVYQVGIILRKLKYDEDLESNPYISVIMGAGDRTILYEQMNQMLSSGVTG